MGCRRRVTSPLLSIRLSIGESVPEIYTERGGEVSNAQRAALPKHNEYQVLGISNAELSEERYKHTRHVITGGVASAKQR